jgi:undecaprenyl-diphosphatase
MTAALRFYIATTVLVLLSVVVYFGVSNEWDQLLLSDILKAQTPHSLQFWRFATWLGAPLPVTLAILIGAMVLYVRNDVVNAKLMVMALVAATAMDRPLKFLIHRPRPLEDIAGVMPTSFSFPSGHVLFATVFYGSLAMVLLRNHVARLATIATLTGFPVLLVMASRLCLGVHYPSDVLGGLFSGLVCLTAAMWFEKFQSSPGI